MRPQQAAGGDAEGHVGPTVVAMVALLLGVAKMKPDGRTSLGGDGQRDRT